MIIEGIQQSLIMRIHRTDAQGSGDAETEESGHLIFDQRLAYSIELTHRQNIQQGGAGDHAMITSTTASQEPSQRLDAAVDDHRAVRQRQ
jgi:hypothetical protein